MLPPDLKEATWHTYPLHLTQAMGLWVCLAPARQATEQRHAQDTGLTDDAFACVRLGLLGVHSIEPTNLGHFSCTHGRIAGRHWRTLSTEASALMAKKAGYSPTESKSWL